MFSEATLRKLWPHGDSKVPGLIKGIMNSAPKQFAGWGNTEIAQAMAQFSHECGAGLEMTENINYTAQRAVQVWPTRFKSVSDCYAKVGSYPGDPDFSGKLIDSVYGTRMGNRPGTHDGRTYIGRGLSQTTGREGYDKLGKATNLPLLDKPTLVNSPDYALECAVSDFVLCGCLPFAKADDVLNVTKRLNGGTVGLEQRKQWLANWKKALATQAPYIVPAPAPTPVPIAPKPVQPKPAAPPVLMQPKHATGVAAIVAAIAVGIQFNSPAVIIGVIALGVGTAIGLHFLWKGKASP